MDMRNIKTYILLLVLVGLTSCSTEIDFEEYFDKSLPLSLTINTTNPQTGLTESKTEIIKVNSKIFNSMLEWLNENNTGWQKSIASHIGDTNLTQESFKLIYTKNSEGVVVSFIDSTGNPKQFSKSINNQELNFLY